ncbi:hypothetical protein C6P40_002488 [Pichia californica]|uniref:Cleavage/polyadenylation specificity factor A subunit N-terminal domain-containing protein n=1 Tax=Pichia californica TaxID=460514 RepID=A0A9P7BCU2_9ASCO|nr:hypothetical protein C6P40_002488 [[Candida] californica]
MENLHKSLYNTTILYSRVPIYLLYRFKINTLRNGDGTINNTRYTSLNEEQQHSTTTLMNKNAWRSILGNKTNYDNNIEFRAAMDIKSSDKPTANDNLDDSYEPFLDQESTYVTMFIYFNSFSINNGICHELPSPVICAEVIRSIDESQEDTLVFYLEKCIVLIRFLTSNINEYIPYVIDSIDLELPDNQTSTLSKINFTKNTMILSLFDGLFFHYDINYNVNGIPSLIHSHNTYQKSNIKMQCNVPKGSFQESLLISLSVKENDKLYADCIYITSSIKIHSEILNEALDECTNLIPLSDTGAVLLTCNKYFIIKPFTFFVSGDNRVSYKSSYNKLDSFCVSSYYIPETKFKTLTSFDDFLKEFHKHDQILITSNKELYILDIFYDTRNMKFTSTFTLFFKTDYIFKNFILEPLDDSLFHLIYSSREQHESKHISVMSVNGIPVLKTQKSLWLEIHCFEKCDPILVNSFESKYTFESKQDLWIKHPGSREISLVKFGFSSKFDNSVPNLYNVNKFYNCSFSYFETTYIWGSGDKNSILYKVSNNNVQIDPVISSLINQEILSVESSNNDTQYFKDDSNTNSSCFKFLEEKLVETDNKSNPVRKFDRSISIFVPYQIIYLKEFMKFIITSRNGEYQIIKLNIAEISQSLLGESSKIVKLNDSGCVSILHQNKCIIYFSNNDLWKLNISQSLYPKKVEIENHNANGSACGYIPSIGKNREHLITCDNIEIKIWSIRENNGFSLKIFDLGREYQKICYYDPLGIFILLSDSSNCEESKWSYFNPRTGLVKDLEDIFDQNDHPKEIYAFKKPGREDEEWFLIVGGIWLNILEVQYINGKIQLNIVSSTKKNSLITDIHFEPNNEILFYSCGQRLMYQKYSRQEQKFLGPKHVFSNMQDNEISKFEIHSFNKGKFCLWFHDSNNKITESHFDEGYTISDERKVDMPKILIFPSGDFLKYDDHSGKIEMNCNNQDGEVIELKHSLKCLAINSFPSWVSVDMRDIFQNEHFITFGGNGQVELLNIVSNNDPFIDFIRNRQWSKKRIGLLSKHRCMVNTYPLKSRYDDIDHLTSETECFENSKMDETKNTITF